MSPATSPGRVETLNGGPIYFDVHGSGEPVLLLHGFSGSSQDWKAVAAEWSSKFQLIIPDLRGHGRSGTLAKPFRFDESAADIFALMHFLKIGQVMGIGISGGANVLLHMAIRQPERVKAMVLVSSTSYFPPQARAIMRQYGSTMPAEQWNVLRRSHPGGDAQIQAILDSTASFADSYDDLNFTPPLLGTIQARTLIVQGDRDPLYPVEISVEMARAIPQSSLWIVPNAGHGPVFGEKWTEFLKTAFEFLRE